MNIGRVLAGLLPWTVARAIALPAIVMPYRIRAVYIRGLSTLTHAPFKAFGAVSRYMLDQLRIEALPRARGSEVLPSPPESSTAETAAKGDAIAVLFSGGTDSTCTAALMAGAYRTVHLLTCSEYATRSSPFPKGNADLLRAHFSGTRFVHEAISVDPLVRYFSYERYARTLWAHGFLVLATPGFSTLSWHVRTIAYCLQHGITRVADGLTRELMHFPGHMDPVVVDMRALYASYGITYENPVRDWPTPPDQQFIDKLIVNRHGGDFILGDARTADRKTTGKYLYDRGIFPSGNVKGSKMDFLMQHDCYPFALYNILAFWGFMSIESYPAFCARVQETMHDKLLVARTLLDEYRDAKDTSVLGKLIARA